MHVFGCESFYIDRKEKRGEERERERQRQRQRDRERQKQRGRETDRNRERERTGRQKCVQICNSKLTILWFNIRNLFLPLDPVFTATWLMGLTQTLPVTPTNTAKLNRGMNNTHNSRGEPTSSSTGTETTKQNVSCKITQSKNPQFV